MPDFRRGAAEIAKAQEKSEGGSFRPFTPQHFWKDDGDSKYLLFLNPLDDIPTVDLIGFIPVKKKKANGESYTLYEQVIARTDPALGEEDEPMVAEWQAKPKQTNVAVAVELEPTFEEVNGRKRPVGFEVKTTEYDRRIRDDEGNLTDDTETVEAPAVGFISQSPHNFFNVVTSFDANEATIEDTAVRITKVGVKTATTFTVAGYPTLDVDLSKLIDYADGISYIGDTEAIDDVLDQIEGLEDAEAAQLIGSILLDKRLEELCDRERYDELFEGITETLDKFGNSNKKSSSGKSEKRERPARRSQRRSRSEEAPEESPAEEAAPEEAPETESKPARRARKPKEKAPEPEPEAEKESAPADSANKLATLKARQEKRKAAIAA